MKLELLIVYVISYFVFYLLLRKFTKRYGIMLFLAASVMGLIWEIVTADIWTYNTALLDVFIFNGQEIPVVVPFSWGLIFIPSLILVNFIQEKIFRRKEKMFFLLSSVLAMIPIGFLVEYIGIVFGLWTYTYSASYSGWISVVPIQVLLGWVFFGTMMLSVIKFYSTRK